MLNEWERKLIADILRMIWAIHNNDVDHAKLDRDITKYLVQLQGPPH